MDISEFWEHGNVQEALAAKQTLESVVEIANSVQQLKAEIAALISEYLTDIERGEQHRMALFIHKMRQLSAV